MRSLTRPLAAMAALLLLANAGAWLAALSVFRDHPLLLGTALLAYTLGLRHAVDADHIAAIDNVTRKLIQRGRRPWSAGLFFSLGHSTVVVGLSAAVVLGSLALKGRFAGLETAGRTLGTAASSLFLLSFAAFNLLIFRSVYRTFRSVREGGTWAEEDLDLTFARGGRLGSLLRRLFGLIEHGWQMFPVGLLFGLGFDTATEVALLGISAAEATRGLPAWSIMVFPALFASGMALVDSADSFLMVGAYGWAFVKPIRKLYYNMTITLVSVLVALLVGGIEALGLAADRFMLRGRLWDLVEAFNGHSEAVGMATVGVFVAGWIVSAGIYRWRGFDDIEVVRR